MKKIANIALSVLLSVSLSLTAFGADNTTPFIDISTDSWYYSYVEDVYEKEIMAGMSATAFSPDISLTRGMAASLIYRMYGSPEVSFSNKFTDVEAGLWYTDGIMWASENGIVYGYGDNSYCPDWAITVEQMASIFYRLAGSPDETDSTVLDDYADGYLVSNYARTAMCWAAENGLLEGDTLHPTNVMTRSEAAKMLSVFTTIYDYRAIKATGAISDYITTNYDSTFDFTEYEYTADESDDDIYLYYKVEGWVSTFGYRAVMSGEKLLRVEMIGIMNPYFLTVDLEAPDITDEEVLQMAADAFEPEESEDDNTEEEVEITYTVSEQSLTKYFDMDNLQFVYSVETTITDSNRESYTYIFNYIL